MADLVLHELLTGMVEGTGPLRDKLVSLSHGGEGGECTLSLIQHLLALAPVLTQLTAVLPAQCTQQYITLILYS